MDRESLRLLLAQGVSVEEIGRRFGKSPATVSYWLKKFGFEAPNRDKYAAKGGIERRRLQEFVEVGMTIREIAAALGLSAGMDGASSVAKTGITAHLRSITWIRATSASI